MQNIIFLNYLLLQILQKMGYYLITIGKRKVLVNYEYIEKLEKKKKNF